MNKLYTLLFFFSFYTSYSQVVINELDADTPSSDVLEFIELKTTNPNTSLNGYVLVFFNATTNGLGITSYYAIDLDGFTTDVNGIIHFGNTNVTPTPVLTFPINTIQNGPDAVAIYLGNDTDYPFGTSATSANLIDALAYSNNATTGPTALMSIFGLSTFINENQTLNAATHSIQRKTDGTYEVKAPTPGANNDGSGTTFNQITVSTSAQTITEGETLVITFSTSQPIENANLIINFSLSNGNFSIQDFYGTLTVHIPVGESSVSTNVDIVDDSLDEGNEEMLIHIGSLPAAYQIMNNDMVLRVYDNDYVVEAYGSPLNPTYGIVTPEIPAGYYDTLEGLSGSALKQALQDIIANPTVVREHTYGDVAEILKIADKNPQNSNQVWQMYVENPRDILDFQTGSSNIGVWNREHIWPQSRGGFQDGTSSVADGISIWASTDANDILAGHADAHHIRAEDGNENSARSNRDYGSDYNGPTGNTGSWKGDVARALFYMAIRYNGLNLVNGNPADTTVGQMGDLASLLTWNATDVSDDYEMHRNNYIYTWQMNRNPFIDYPLLADYIFGSHYGDVWSFSLSNQDIVEEKILVYPNPASEYIIVSGISSESNLEIYTISGQLIKSVKIINNQSIPLNYPQGVYLVKIKTIDKEEVKKIVVK